MGVFAGHNASGVILREQVPPSSGEKKQKA